LEGAAVTMNWLSNFFAGRNGLDPLTMFLLVVCFVFSLLLRTTNWLVFGLLYYLLLLYCIFRALSRNLPARQEENRRFLAWAVPARARISALWRARKSGETTYRYFKCPSCGEKLRVPKHRGKLRITCPKCRTQFEKKT